MNHLLISVFIFTFASLQYISGKAVTNTGPAFEITDGNCTNATLGDLVFQDHSHKLPIPFVKRDHSSHWAGDEKIYCVQVLSQESNSVKSTAEITEGGANHTFVTIKMQSAKGKGFEYNIQVFGKK